MSCKQSQPDWIDRQLHKELFDINLSESIETYATSENPSQIENTIKNLEQAKGYFDKVFEEKLNFAVLFVDNKNWNKYAFIPPPGMPQAHYEGNMILGLGKSMMATRAEQGLQNIPESELSNLKKYYGEEVDLDLFFRDGLSLHELGHLYQFYKTGKNSQRRWLDEIFGNLCQVGAARNMESQEVFNRMDSYQMLLVQQNRWGELKYKTLVQFEEDYLDVMKQGQNYGWYQTQFYLMAKELHSKYGDEFLNIFRDFLIDTNPTIIGKLSNEGLQELMIENLGQDAVEILQWKYETLNDNDLEN
jgi:hypothetical protein